jgi:uncharacterized coiled-coil DUF342 family protein
MPVHNSGLSQLLIQQQHDLKQDLREQRQELREQRQELKQDLKEVKHEIKELATKQDLKEVKHEIKELRLAGQHDLKELKQGLASKQELRWYAITLLLIAAAAGAKELLSFVKVL